MDESLASTAWLLLALAALDAVAVSVEEAAFWGGKNVAGLP